MALGRGALDLGIVFHGNKYAVEIKLAANYAKNRVKSHEQLKRYLDTLGVNEGWLVVFDTLENTDWDAKISHSDIPIDGKTIGIVLCRSRNDIVAEYALADLDKPIGVSTYQLGLPPLEQLQKKLQQVLSLPKKKGRS